MRVWYILSRFLVHYNDVIMGVVVSQITSITIVYSSVYSGTDKKNHQSSASLAFVREIHRRPVNSPLKGPVTRKKFPFDDVVMILSDLAKVQVQYYESRSHLAGVTAGRHLTNLNMMFNSLAPGGCGSNFKSVLLKVITQNHSLDTCCEIAPMWMPQNLN